MSKEKDVSTMPEEALAIDEVALFERATAIIENRKYRTYAHVNQKTMLMFWEVGEYINSVVLGNKRAEYGKKTLATLSAKLAERYE